jgi:hypothetical protein
MDKRGASIENWMFKKEIIGSKKQGTESQSIQRKEGVQIVNRDIADG